jgi:hypothetical protein
VAEGQLTTLTSADIQRFERDGYVLVRQAFSGADGLAMERLMDRETIVDGVPLRVVELTGEAGDMVFCHPVMVHCVAPNRGTRPRFMRIKTQVLTHEGREQRNRQQRLPS